MEEEERARRESPDPAPARRRDEEQARRADWSSWNKGFKKLEDIFRWRPGKK